MTPQTPQNGTRIGSDFNAVTFARLVEEFQAIGPEARGVFAAFQSAAEKVQGRRAFNDTAKPARQQSLLRHLPSAAEMQAIRKFEAAREALVAVDPALGAKIARHVSKRGVSF